MPGEGAGEEPPGAGAVGDDDAAREMGAAAEDASAPARALDDDDDDDGGGGGGGDDDDGSIDLEETSSGSDADPPDDDDDDDDDEEEEEEEVVDAEVEQMWQGMFATLDAENAALVDTGSDDDYESESDYESEFDEDAMHFEIEGEIPVGAGSGGADGGDDGGGPDSGDAATTDPEEQGVYMLHDGRFPTHTGLNHQQGSDSVCAASPGRLLVTGVGSVTMLDAREEHCVDKDGGVFGGSSPNGYAEVAANAVAVLGQTERLPFHVYSVTYDAEKSLVAACGSANRDEDVNLAVWRVVDVAEGDASCGAKSEKRRAATAAGRAVDEATDVAGADAAAEAFTGALFDLIEENEMKPSVAFVPVAELGLGKVGRYGREMVNCVRFGKIRDSDKRDWTGSDVNPDGTRDVLLCASQDAHCYVVSINTKDDAGGDGCDVEDSGSDGGQGGRGARRRRRMNAELGPEGVMGFPTAVNAAAASPNGMCVAVVGDCDCVLVHGGPEGYGMCGHVVSRKPIAYYQQFDRYGGSEMLPIDGDPETLSAMSGEPHGGMYVSWSPNSEYLAVTSDSLHAVAVWRVEIVSDWDYDVDVDAGGESLDAAAKDSRRSAGGRNSAPPSPARPPKQRGRGRGAAWGSAGELRTSTRGPLRITRVAYLRDHAHPCLPITFLPSDPEIVVWAERGGRVHAYDLRCANAAGAGMCSAVNLSPPARPRSRSRSRSRDAPTPTLAAAAEGGAEAEGGGTGTAEEAAVGDDDDDDDDPDFDPDVVDEYAFAPPDDEDGADVSMLPLGPAWSRRSSNQRQFVQTVRSRVKGLYVTGLCAVAAPPPPPPPATALGPRSLTPRAPPHDFVFVGTPNGVLRFRCPVSWTPENHQDFPVGFRDAARTFLLCARADGGGANADGGASLGDMPPEVLLHVVALAAVPPSDWIGVGGDGEEKRAAATATTTTTTRAVATTRAPDPLKGYKEEAVKAMMARYFGVGTAGAALFTGGAA